MWLNEFAVGRAQLMKGDFEMIEYIPLVGFTALGFAVWIGILKLWTLYEERTPPAIQTRLYTRAKNLPRDVLNLILSCLIWAGMGALLLRFVLGLVGLDGWLPSTPWALPVIYFFVFGGLYAFWESPAPSERIQPRGRGLGHKAENKASPRTSRPTTTAGNTRGRTIRSYHDIK